jgi:F1F0 ATPase subunit 2
MNETLFMVLAFTAGLFLGILFFLGLWVTVKKVVIAKIPAIWVFVSFFLRVSIIMIGFYYVSQGSWQRLLLCVLGFIIARFLVTRFTKSMDEKTLIKKLHHEA